MLELFKYSPPLEQVYQFQNKLTDIFNKNINQQEAEKLINEWINSVNESELSCFKKFIVTLNKYKNDILNYFYRKQRKNSGFIEGLNNKIKVLKRRCYGILKDASSANGRLNLYCPRLIASRLARKLSI